VSQSKDKALQVDKEAEVGESNYCSEKYGLFAMCRALSLRLRQWLCFVQPEVDLQIISSLAAPSY